MDYFYKVYKPCSLFSLTLVEVLNEGVFCWDFSLPWPTGPNTSTFGALLPRTVNLSVLVEVHRLDHPVFQFGEGAVFPITASIIIFNVTVQYQE